MNKTIQKFHQSIFIKAPPKKVWKTMISDATYRKWTKPFHPNSYFMGNWEKGSKILFLGPSTDGKGDEGMISRVADNRPYEFISLEHIGIVKNGEEDTTSEEARKWSPSFENYTFVEKKGGTELNIEMDLPDEYKAMMEEMWPKALKELKKLSEKK